MSALSKTCHPATNKLGLHRLFNLTDAKHLKRTALMKRSAVTVSENKLSPRFTLVGTNEPKLVVMLRAYL